MMQYRNAAYNAFGAVDVEIEHPVHGWIPFTAAPDDPEQFGREFYAELLLGEVSPYTPPPEPTPEELRELMPPLNPGQIRLALLSIGITEDMVDAQLVDDPAGMIEWKYRPSYRRLHPLVVGLAAPSKFNLPAEQVDALWVWAAEL